MDALEKYHEEFIKQSIFRLNENLPRIVKCLGLLSEDQIWYSQNDNSNSIGNLVIHLCGNIFQYVNTSLGGALEVRQRELEFSSHNSLNRSELIHKIEKTIKDAELTIRVCDINSMTDKIQVQVYSLSKISIIGHVIEHLSYHTGQIAFITKAILDKDLAFYGGVDL